MKKVLLAAVVTALLASSAFSQTTSPTSQVLVNVAAEAALTVPTDATLTSTGTNFADYKGTSTFTYFIRTTQSTGTGSITLKVTSDFSPSGGPSVATPPTSGDALTYVPTVSSPASSATVQTASTSAGTNVASFGAGAHSTKSGNSGSVDWTLTNDPVYSTGAYSATVTWTISAT